MACKFLSRFVNNIPECFWFLHGVPKIRELVLPWHVAVQLDLPVWFLCKNALFPNQRCPSYAAPSKTKPETKLILYCAQLVHNPDKPVTVLKTGQEKQLLGLLQNSIFSCIPKPLFYFFESTAHSCSFMSPFPGEKRCLLFSKASTQLYPGCVLMPLHCWCYYGDFYLPNLF